MHLKLHNTQQIHLTTISMAHVSASCVSENAEIAWQPPIPNHTQESPQQVHSVISTYK